MRERVAGAGELPTGSLGPPPVTGAATRSFGLLTPDGPTPGCGCRFDDGGFVRERGGVTCIIGGSSLGGTRANSAAVYNDSGGGAPSGLGSTVMATGGV